MIKLYEFPPTRSIRVRWTLQELEVPFESVTVDMMNKENESAEYLKINPAGRVPALVDGELVLFESVACALYVAEKYVSKGFFPTDLQQKGRLYQWMFFTATELEQPLWRMASHTQRYPEEERLPGDVRIARREFKQMVKVLEQHMVDRPFLLGDQISVGDFVLGYTLDWANEVKLLKDCPRLSAYLEELYQRPRAPLRIAEAFASLKQPR
jgi:glutathione S-transferase